MEMKYWFIFILLHLYFLLKFLEVHLLFFLIYLSFCLIAKKERENGKWSKKKKKWIKKEAGERMVKRQGSRKEKSKRFSRGRPSFSFFLLFFSFLLFHSFFFLVFWLFLFCFSSFSLPKTWTASSRQEAGVR